MDSLENKIASGILLLVCVGCMVANGYAIFLLSTKRPKKVADILLLHLCVTDIAIVIWDVTLGITKWLMVTNEVQLNFIWDIGLQLLCALFYQSIICISWDRFLAARLHLTYRAIVTKSKLKLVVILMWVLSLTCAIISVTNPSPFKNTTIWVFWSVLTIFSIGIPYTYVFIVIYRQKRRFTKDSTRIIAPNFKYEIPLCITVSYILLVFIPDVMIMVDIRLLTGWILVIYHTNYLVDPLVYVLLTSHYKRRLNRQLSVPRNPAT